MAFPKHLLAENEELVLDLRPHWIALVAPIIVTVLLIAVVVILLVRFELEGVAAMIAVGLALLVFLLYPVRAFLAWATSHFVVTSDRLIHRSGWLARRSMEMPLERINDVRFEQTVFERIVGAGDLRIESGGELGQNHFRDIRKPESVQKLIFETAEENQNRMMRGSGRLTADASASAASGLSDESLALLERLADMKKRGVISAEEFEAQKRRLLGRP